MLHAHPLCTNMIEGHLADLIIYKKLNSNLTQTIRNGVLSTLDFLYGSHLVDYRTRNHLTPFVWPPQSLYILPPPLSPNVSSMYSNFLQPPQNLYILLPLPHTKASMYFTFLRPLQNLFTLLLPSPSPLQPILLICDSRTNQLSNYVTHFL